MPGRSIGDSTARIGSPLGCDTKRSVLTLLAFAAACACAVAQDAAPPKAAPAVVTPEQKAKMARAEELGREMDALYSSAKYEQAIPVADELVSICRELVGEQNAQTAFAIHQLAFFHYSCGHHEDAKKLNEQALAIRRAVLGNQHPHVALSLANLANALFGLGDYERALACQKEAIAIYRGSIGEGNRDAAILLREIAATCAKLTNHAETEGCFKQALVVQEQALGENDFQVGHTLHLYSNWLIERGRNTEARPLLERSVAIHRDKQPDPSYLPIVLESLGLACRNTNALDAAEKACQESLTLYRQSVGAEHEFTAQACINLGVVFLLRGEYARAKPFYVYALAIQERKLGESHPSTIYALLELGHMHEKMSDYVSARSFFEKALATLVRKSGEQSADTLEARIALAATLGALGDQRGATAQFQQALAIAQKSLPQEHQNTAYVYHELGNFLSSLGKHDQAVAYLERALRIRWKVMGPQSPRTANSLQSLAISCAMAGNYAKAQTYYERTLALQKVSLPESHPSLAYSHNDLGYVAACAGDFKTAVAELELALQLGRKSMPDTHPLLTRAQANLAICRMMTGHLGVAADITDQSRRAVRRHVGSTLALLSEREQLTYLASSDAITLHDALSLGVRGKDDPRIAALSAGWLLNSKSLAEELLAQRTSAARDSADVQVRQLAERLRAVRAKQSCQVSSGLNQKLAQATTAARAELAREEEELSRQLAAALKQAEAAVPWVELDDVRAKLAPDEVFVNLSRVFLVNFGKTAATTTRSERYVAWIIPRQGDVKIVDLGETKAIEEAVMAMRVALKSIYQFDTVTGAIKSIDKEAAQLFDAAFLHTSQLVMHPLVKHLGTAKQLAISPDAALWLVPWSALLLTDGRFAVEQYQIRHLVSGRELVAPERSYPLARPMIVAGPDFDLDRSAAADLTKSVLASGKLGPQPAKIAPATLRDAKAKRLATPLPGSEKEAQLVAPHLAKYAGKSPGVLTGRYALEGLVKAVHHPSVVLFSTHGYFDASLAMTRDERRWMETYASMSGGALPAGTRPPDNPLLLGGLLLAGCNAQGAGEDGILSGMEIVGLDLRGTKLVVLSACDTGVGELRIGDGVAGVRQAFQLAGAESVVATLWTVLDRESTQQMTDFFSHLAAGQSKAAALRAAQLAAIGRLKKQFGTTPPLLWAAFTVTGK